MSNEKFNDLQHKFPDLSFGILTGDIKFNPEADVIIMTTEILYNTLFQKKMIEENTNLFQYKDKTLFNHQKDIFNIFKIMIFSLRYSFLILST